MQIASARIVHLGLGAFARAHLAAYTQDANEAAQEGDITWQIIGVSLRRPDMRDALLPQGGLYTLVTRAPDGPHYRIMNTVSDCCVAAENPSAIIALMADAATHIVTLTVTEKGYCHDPATGNLLKSHPDIQHDLARPEAPRSAIGMIVAGLAARHGSLQKPFTVLCCDNLPANGKVVRGLVLEFAHERDPALAAWIASLGAFPSTMVDRIVPATTALDIAQTAAATGLHDAAPVMAEPFRQWVIEDQFASIRPAWEKAGAQLVTDVLPFEFMKLRLLNGAHSALAYTGYLAGHETIAEASADPAFTLMLLRLWDEIIPTVPAPEGVDLADYTQALLTRFRNPAIRHRNWQIAMDGSQKLPQRLLHTIQDRLTAGMGIETLSLGVAGWMRYVMGRDESGASIDIRDPFAAEFKNITTAANGNAEAVTEGLLGLKAIFGQSLPRNAALRNMLVQHLRIMLDSGVRAALNSPS